MPEGDTIRRTARSLRPALENRQVLRARRPGNDELPCQFPQQVVHIETRGKHLLIHLEDGTAIHSHMGMTGSWHIYERDQAWQKPAFQAALVLETESHCMVCFSPRHLEFLSPDGLRRHRWLKQLGPDLLGSKVDTEEILKRLAGCGSVPIGVALLDQRICCGIGNVYKSEVLFVERLSPFRLVDSLPPTSWRDVMMTCRRMMLRNLEGYPRTTRFGRDGGRQWVYGRSGQPCFRCGTTIQMRRQGEMGRSTYYCQNCQR